MTLFLFVLGLAFLVAGAELLVRGASRIAALVGISPLVVGLTVVAFGTSAPELAVTVAATARGDVELALGNVVGSNISNVLLILGISALVAPLVVQRSLVRVEVPLLVATSAAVWIMAIDGRLGRLDGLVLLGGGLAYAAFLVRQAVGGGERASTTAPAEAGEAPAGDSGARTDVVGSRVGRATLDAVLIVVGLVLLAAGSHRLVDSARTFALALGVSRLAVGLTIVAVGTSLPELATSVMATVRGQRDIAVGNVVGSNLFNVLVVLGAAAVIAPAGIPVPTAAFTFDLPVMLAVSVACLPIFFTGHRIARWEGALFLAYFVAYITYVLLAAAGHEGVAVLRTGLVAFALPLTAVTLALVVIREIRTRD